MTVPTTAAVISAAGDDSTIVFPFPYYFLVEGDLTVKLFAADGTPTTLTITTHYSVADAGVPSGGSVTMVTAPATGEILTIVREPDYTQDLELVPNDPVPADEVEQALDRTVMQIQRLADLIGRAVAISDSDSGSLTLPNAAARASKAFTFDASGNPTATALTDFGTAIASTVGATLMTALSETAARAAISVDQVVSTETSDKAIVLADYGGVFNLEAGVSNVTFAAAATLTAEFWVKLINNSGGSITVNPDGAENINNATTLSLGDGSGCIVWCDGTEFFALTGGAGSAAAITFDPSSSNLVATDVQAALDEVSPMTTIGDIIYGGVGALPTRLAKGGAFEALTMDSAGSLPEWTPGAGKQKGIASAASSIVFTPHIEDGLYEIHFRLKKSQDTNIYVQTSDNAGTDYTDTSGDVAMVTWYESFGGAFTSTDLTTTTGFLLDQGANGGVGSNFEQITGRITLAFVLGRVQGSVEVIGYNSSGSVTLSKAGFISQGNHDSGINRIKIVPGGGTITGPVFLREYPTS